jgi:hypothetical protein
LAGWGALAGKRDTLTSNRAGVDPEQETSTGTVLEHHSYRIGLWHTQVDWIGFVTRRGQRPILILAPDRDAVIATAQAWIEEQTGAKMED